MTYSHPSDFTRTPLRWRILLARQPRDYQATAQELLEEVLGREKLNQLLAYGVAQDWELLDALQRRAEHLRKGVLKPRSALWVEVHGVEAYRRLYPSYAQMGLDMTLYRMNCVDSCNQMVRERLISQGVQSWQ